MYLVSCNSATCRTCGCLVASLCCDDDGDSDEMIDVEELTGATRGLDLAGAGGAAKVRLADSVCMDNSFYEVARLLRLL